MTLARLQSLSGMALYDSREHQVSNRNFGRDTVQAAQTPPPGPEAGDDFQRQLAALIQAIDATSHRRATEAAPNSGEQEHALASGTAPQAESVTAGEAPAEPPVTDETSFEQPVNCDPASYATAEEPDPYETYSYYDSPEQGIEYSSLPNVLTQPREEETVSVSPAFDEDDDKEFDKPAFPLINPSTLLSGRFIGFAAGLGASVAVGGMVLFGGFSEPTAVASYLSSADSVPTIASPDEVPVSVSTKLQSRLADAVVRQASQPQPQLAGTLIEGTAPRISTESPLESTSDQSVTLAKVDESVGNLPSTTLPEQDAPAPVIPGAQVFESPETEPATETAALVEPQPAPPPVRVEPQNTANPKPSNEIQLKFDTIVEPSTPAEPAREAVVKRDVNMRAGPNTSEPVVTIVSGGSPIEVISCNGWCEVVYEGKRGWIYKDFLEVSSLEDNGTSREISNRL